VDEMGGLDRAIELVRGKAKIPRGESVDLVVYPAQRSLVERLLNRSTEARTPAWLGAVLKRWPVTVFSGSGYLRLAPYSLEVK